MRMAVNLLPAEYVRSIAKHRQMRILMLTGIACVCAALLWWRIAATKLNPVLNQTRDIKKQIEVEKSTARSLEQSQAMYRKLGAIEAIRGEMNEPIEVAKVMELLSQLMPQETALTRLTLTLPKLPDQKIAAKGAAKEAPKAEPSAPAPILIEMQGIAKSNPEVAKCMGALANHPLFTNVKLSNSKQLMDSKITIVSFQITMEIPVNRKFVTQGGEIHTEASANAQ